MKHSNFIDRERLYSMIGGEEPSAKELDEILKKALLLEGLTLEQVAILLRVNDAGGIQRIMDTAKVVKEEIYGKRLVLFAPVYTGNVCINNCTYCAFRISNKDLARKVLDMDEIENETRSLLREGQKRILLICGETSRNDTDYMVEAIRRVYATKEGDYCVKRINVELAPMSVQDFRKIKAEKIGTYVCFQETYDERLYQDYHPAGSPKADFLNRLTVMDRAMEAGIDDVGLGVLFGLADYRFEVLALMEHARHLETHFGCGPHTISFPRIEFAEGAPLTENIPYPLSDANFMKIIAIIRIALPYTGIILSTRENDAMRTSLFEYGVSQISAGSRTNPGSYSDESTQTGSQFSLGDHRSLEEVISSMIDSGYIPSFCTGCYRKGRVGKDFMDLAKPGLIKEFCFPNALFTFKEYLEDFASEETKQKGLALLEKMVNSIERERSKNKVEEALDQIEKGERDVFL